MKRGQLVVLWIATIVATWLVVRGCNGERAQPREESVTAPMVSNRTATRDRPALVRHGRTSLDDQVLEPAMAALERDLADGEWSTEDRERLTVAMRGMSGPNVAALYKQLFRRLNSGAAKNVSDGPPI